MSKYVYIDGWINYAREMQTEGFLYPQSMSIVRDKEKERQEREAWKLVEDVLTSARKLNSVEVVRCENCVDRAVCSFKESFSSEDFCSYGRDKKYDE